MNDTAKYQVDGCCLAAALTLLLGLTALVFMIVGAYSVMRLVLP